jgi:hypothetical protein
VDSNKEIHKYFQPSSSTADDVGVVAGPSLGVTTGAVGLGTGRLVGVPFPEFVGPDPGFPVELFGASVNSDGDFVGFIVVGAIGEGVNMDAIPKFKHSFGTLVHVTYTKLGHAMSSVEALGHVNELNGGNCDGHCGYVVSVIT